MKLECLPYVTSAELGFDIRAGNVWIDIKQQQLITKDRENFERYAYVRDDGMIIGSLVIYTAKNKRIREAIDYYKQIQEQIKYHRCEGH